ncbi:MAG: caspase family protein [Planctomycetaceae bacterium]
MNRGVILIGVKKAGSLPELQAVYDGVDGMCDWAVSQGIPASQIKTVTDKTKPVTPQDIKDAIKQLLQPGTLEQLIIYFAGHGVNLAMAEYWLLSDAIIDPDAAVNLSASELLARRNGVPHVVFISDACRTAPAGIQAQSIKGSTIFPNVPPAGPQKHVDLFFATLVGDPALEIRDPNDAANGYKAVYTEAMLEVLRGLKPDIAELDPTTGKDVIRPWPLRDYLERELPNRVFQATMASNPRNQIPDAQITSRPTAWISLLTGLPVGNPPGAFGGPAPEDAIAHANAAKLAAGRTDLVTRSILEKEGLALESALASIPFTENIARNDLDIFTAGNRRYRNNVREIASPFGPLHMETRCGFKVRGARLLKITGAKPSDVFDDGTGGHAHVNEHDAASFLLEFDNKAGVLVPALGGFLTSLTFENGLLIDVAYEPSEFTYRWDVFQSRAEDIRNLRSVIASATRQGTFRLQGEDAATLARRMQLSKGIDPSLALYAAHAYRRQGNQQRIHEMAEFMRGDLGICLFDIALLDGQLNEHQDDPQRKYIVPFLPMLSQSWAILAAYDVQLAQGLENIRPHINPNSLWTLLDADGVKIVSEVLRKGETR